MIQLLFFTKHNKIKVENVDFYVCSLWKSVNLLDGGGNIKNSKETFHELFCNSII